MRNTKTIGMMVAIALAVALLAQPATAPVFTGTIEGFVSFINGTGVVGADITATVAGCAGGAANGCVQTGLTDVGFYYVIANLNLPPNGSITGSAVKGPASGSNTDFADQFAAAFINITICEPPSVPTQTPVPDGHFGSALFNWTSGSGGTGGGNLTDRFQLDAGPLITNATPLLNASGLSFASHTWRVQTCNVFNNVIGCCSAFASDTFNIVNGAPSPPILVDEAPTESTTITFEWTSGIDPDGDATIDEFQLSNTSDFSNIIDSGNATSPRTLVALDPVQIYFWRVRTCDSFGACSSYSTDDFFIFVCPALPPIIIDDDDGGRRFVGIGAFCPTQPCTDDCSLDDRVCRGDNARRVCGNFDNDTCLEYKNFGCTGAGEACTDGRCCTENWQCTEWTECIDGRQYRSCSDANQCLSISQQPDELRSCAVPGLVLPTACQAISTLLLPNLFALMLLLGVTLSNRKRQITPQKDRKIRFTFVVIVMVALVLALLVCSCQSVASPFLVLLALAAFWLLLTGKKGDGNESEKTKKRERNLRILISSIVAFAIILPLLSCAAAPFILIAAILVLTAFVLKFPTALSEFKLLRRRLGHARRSKGQVYNY